MTEARSCLSSRWARSGRRMASLRACALPSSEVWRDCRMMTPLTMAQTCHVLFLSTRFLVSGLCFWSDFLMDILPSSPLAGDHNIHHIMHKRRFSSVKAGSGTSVEPARTIRAGSFSSPTVNITSGQIRANAAAILHKCTRAAAFSHRATSTARHGSGARPPGGRRCGAR